jgi:hypothetical protein
MAINITAFFCVSIKMFSFEKFFTAGRVAQFGRLTALSEVEGKLPDTLITDSQKKNFVGAKLCVRPNYSGRLKGLPLHLNPLLSKERVRMRFQKIKKVSDKE